MTTIREVAERAQVSIATVSRVINNLPGVSKSRREHVKQIIKEMGYVPNEAARILNRKQSQFIGLLIPDIMNPFFAQIVQAVEAKAYEYGYWVIFGNYQNDKTRLTHYLSFFESQRVCGIIGICDLPIALPKTIPYVAVDRYHQQDKYIISTNHQQSGELAAKKFVEKGVQRLLMMTSPEKSIVTQARLKGVKKVLLNENIPLEIYRCPNELVENARAIAREALDVCLEKTCDGILAFDDIQALEILRLAEKRGIAVPDDLQIIGFNGIYAGRYANPQLASVRQSALELGHFAVDVLNDLIDQTVDHAPIFCEFQTEFIDGETIK